MIALSRPSPGNITCPFGPRPKPTPTSPDVHYGIDFGWGNGRAVSAAAAGVVVGVGFSGAYGNRVRLSHGDGVESWYCHLADGTILVKVGDAVGRGTHLATMGATGNVTAMHLHFELRVRGVAVDPAPYLATPELAESGGPTLIDQGDDMDAEQARQLKEAYEGVGILRQLITETQQWQGLGALAARTDANVAAIRQLISETQAWEGLDLRVSQTRDAVRQILAQPPREPVEHSADARDEAIAQRVAELLAARLAS